MADASRDETGQPAGDKSKFIRTFAKDVASLGQTIPKEFTPAPGQKKAVVQAPKKPAKAVPPKNPKKPAEEAFPSLKKAQEDPSFVPAAASAIHVPAPERPVQEFKPSPLPFSIPIPAPMPKQPPQVIQSFKPSEEPSPIHTYKTDFADHIDTQKASTFSVLAEQLDASGAPAQKTLIKEKTSFHFIPIIIAVLLILAGTGGVWFAYTFTMHKEIGIPAFSVKTLVFADDRKELAGPDFRGSLIQALTDPIDEGKIRVLYSATASSTDAGMLHIPNDGSVLIQALNLHAPDLLLRNIDAVSTIGMLRMNGISSAFFVLRTTSYERTFSAMLAWESTMASDLSWLYPQIAKAQPVAPVAATTTAGGVKPKVATTTPAIIAPPKFKDQVVGNYNLRVLVDGQGSVILCYGYTDKQTLIIARNPDIFVVIAGRIVEPE